MYPSIFDAATVADLRTRLGQLKADTQPQWGKMNAGQMLAHNNVGFDITYGKIPVSYNFFMKLMLKFFVKATVVGNKPYQKNGQTAPVFIVDDERDFDHEMELLLANIDRVHQDGAAAFEGRVSPSFGKLSSQEWSNQFWKHLDHHLTQFGM